MTLFANIVSIWQVVQLVTSKIRTALKACISFNMSSIINYKICTLDSSISKPNENSCKGAIIDTFSQSLFRDIHEDSVNCVPHQTNFPELSIFPEIFADSYIYNQLNLDFMTNDQDWKNQKGSQQQLCSIVDVVDNNGKNKDFNAKDNGKKPPGEAKNKETELFCSMKYELNRLKSFQNNWPLNFIKPTELAAVGLFYLQKNDNVQCAFCRGIISDWRQDDHPLAEHARHFPMCPFLLDQEVGNVPITGKNGTQKWQVENSHSECRHSHESTQEVSRRPATTFIPKFPIMSSVVKRFESYQNWPTSAPVNTEQLAIAGLFYSGSDDAVTCFCCGGVLGQWESGDEPWTEHAKHFPSCVFLKQTRGQAFIENARSGARNIEQHVPHQAASIPPRTNDRSEQSDLNSEVESFMKSELAGEASKIFSSTFVKSAVTKRIRDNGSSFSGLQELCDAVLKLKTDESTPCSAKSSEAPKLNSTTCEQLQDNRLCKICMDQEMGAVFLPCGHILACPKCAQAVSICPLCRKDVLSTIRAYIS